MRKTHKKILGFLSLVIVAAMTVFAATLPTPGAKATTSTSVTDVVRVTVIGRQIKVEIVDPKGGEIFINPNQQLSVEQEHSTHIDLSGVYTDPDGNKHPFAIGSYDPTDVHDINTRSFNLDDYGYGDFSITAVGLDEDGMPSPEYTVEFSYRPIISNIDESDPDGDVYVDLDYYADNVCSADIDVFIGDKKITPPSPIHVDAPETRVKIPTEGLESADYKVITTAYDCPLPGNDPEALPYPYADSFKYEKKDDGGDDEGGDEDEDEDIPVPDTGGNFMGLNISKADYMITAIIMFFAFAGLALAIVAKGRRNNKRR